MARRDNDLLRCDRCRMHRSLCLCDQLPQLRPHTRLCLVTHHHEQHKTTNTGRLVAHSVAGCELWVHGQRGQVPQQPRFDALRPVLLYPDPGAAILTAPPPGQPPLCLVVIDASWRQAQRMRHRLPWLAQLPTARLPAGAPGAFALRHARDPMQLSTLEAIARALGVLEGPQLQAPLERLLRVMVDRTLFSRGVLPHHRVTGGLPAHVRPHDPIGDRADAPHGAETDPARRGSPSARGC